MNSRRFMGRPMPRHPPYHITHQFRTGQDFTYKDYAKHQRSGGVALCSVSPSIALGHLDQSMGEHRSARSQPTTLRWILLRFLCRRCSREPASARSELRRCVSVLSGEAQHAFPAKVCNGYPGDALRAPIRQ